MKYAVEIRSGGMTYTKFRDNWFKHLSNFTVITATILEAVMLVLLIEGIY
jgi:hypothetical protein